MSAIKNFAVPNSAKAVQRFLGVMSLFRPFMGDYALIAKPLSDLLRKDVVFKIGDSTVKDGVDE